MLYIFHTLDYPYFKVLFASIESCLIFSVFLSKFAISSDTLELSLTNICNVIPLSYFSACIIFYDLKICYFSESSSSCTRMYAII